KRRNTDFVGARLARESDASVIQCYRVIVLRGRVSLQQKQRTTYLPSLACAQRLSRRGMRMRILRLILVRLGSQTGSGSCRNAVITALSAYNPVNAQTTPSRPKL